MMVISRRSQIRGSRFKPTKLELVNHYLHRKIEEGKSCSFITEMDIYEKEPWLLQHVRHFRSKKNVWFYFVTRKPVGIKKGNSTKIHRKAGGGRWKTNGILSAVKDNNGVKVGSKQLITFNFKTNIEADKDQATGWVMHEYLLNKPGFQELALCKIKFKPGNAQYAPRLESIVVGHPQPQPQPPLGEYLHVAEEIQYSNVPFDTPHPQHQDFGSCGQLVGAHPQNDILGQVMAAQAMDEQQWNVHSDPYSAQPYDPSQLSMEAQQLWDARYQQLLVEQQEWNVHSRPFSAQPYDPSQVPQAMEEQQWNMHSGPYSAQPYDASQVPQVMVEQEWNMHSGPYSAQPYDPSQLPMEMQQLLVAEYQQWSVEQQENQIIEQANHRFPELGMMTNQATELQQRNEYSGSYSAQPHDQNRYIDESIEKNEEDWDQLMSLIDFEDTGVSEFPMELSTEQQQQQHQIIGQDTQLSSHLPYMMNLEEHQYAHPYHQYFGQNYDLSLMVPMDTQNQDNVIGNSSEEQEQPCEQATDRPINQGIDEPHGGIVGSSTHNKLIQQSLGDEAVMSGHDMVFGKSTPEEETEFMAALGNFSNTDSLLRYIKSF